MTKKILETTRLTDLPVGKFASINGNIVYRYAPSNTGREDYPFLELPGIYKIEDHGHLPMLASFGAYESVDKDLATYGYYCDVIDKPEKKHVDNAICILKKSMKDKKLNGLTYVDNYVTLKRYIKPDEY